MWRRAVGNLRSARFRTGALRARPLRSARAGWLGASSVVGRRWHLRGKGSRAVRALGSRRASDLGSGARLSAAPCRYARCANRGVRARLRCLGAPAWGREGRRPARRSPVSGIYSARHVHPLLGGGNVHARCARTHGVPRCLHLHLPLVLWLARGADSRNRCGMPLLRERAHAQNETRPRLCARYS